MKNGLTIVLSLVVVFAIAQKKPKVFQAESDWKAGEFASAKEIVDAAIVHEKTMDKSKTWYLRGLVYASMDTAGMAEGDLAIAKEAFDKSLEMSGKNEDFITPAAGGFINVSMAVENFWRFYFGRGAENYEVNPEAAIEDFEKSVILLPDSIIGNFYAGVVAQGVDDLDRALKNYLIYMEKGGDDYAAYEQAFIILNTDKEYEKILTLVEKYQGNFEGVENGFSDWKFRALYALDRVDEAVGQLEKQVADDPSNPELHFNLGVIKDNMEKLDEAEKHYKNALKADPEYFNANFNMGVLYRNKIVAKGKEKNDLGYSKADLKRAKEIDDEIVEIAKVALPFWEKSLELRSDDQTVLETLSYIYNVVGDEDKAAEIEKKMEALGYK